VKLPPLSCDSHMHVFGPPARYPGAPTRQYSPTDMPFAVYAPVARGLGLQRVVLVQPSGYGTDNSCMLDTLREHPENRRGVAVVDPAVTNAELDAMHALGVRGARLNLMSPRIGSVAEAERLLEPVAARIGRLGWHIQIYADPAIVAPIAPVIRALSVPVVLDHMAGVRDHQGVDAPDFVALLDLLASGGCWVKVSGADIVTKRDDDFAGAAPFMRALLAANPGQLVWGTDWPHLVHHSGAMGDAAPPAGYRPVDESALLHLLCDVASDEATLRRILVDNPQQLYGFG
jgi:predicted TIM-barrel fold metal-dependent hydrolase